MIADGLAHTLSRRRLDLQHLVKIELKSGPQGLCRLRYSLAHDQANEVVPVLPLGEFHRKAVFEFPDHPPDAGSDGQGGSDRRVMRRRLRPRR